MAARGRAARAARRWLLPMLCAAVVLAVCAGARRVAAGQHGYLDLLPTFKAQLMAQEAPALFAGRCFSSYLASFSADDVEGRVLLHAAQHKQAFCDDWFVFVTSDSLHVKHVSYSGMHESRFKWKAGEYHSVVVSGLQVFLVNGDLLPTLIDGWEQFRLFTGKHSPDFVREQIQVYQNFSYAPRNASNVIKLPASQIHSGDYFAITRMDTTSFFIQVGTGGRTSHVAIALWFGDELKVCEAIGDNHADGLWPPPHGIICTPYDTWYSLCEKVNYLMSYMPLAPKYRDLFNTTAATEFVESVLGLPYGNQNFFYSWIDTPTSNYPPPMTAGSIMGLLPIVERINNGSYAADAYVMVLEGMNQRLGIQCNDSLCLFEYLDLNDLSFEDVTAIPERGEWLYNGHPSLVCSTFAYSMYRAAGIFGDLDFHPTELTPYDAYLVNMFDWEWTKPAECSASTTPDCQVMGEFVFDLPGVSSIEPYDHMFNFCPGEPPNYSRPAQC